jgi:hypothetical protein
MQQMNKMTINDKNSNRTKELENNILFIFCTKTQTDYFIFS